MSEFFETLKHSAIYKNASVEDRIKMVIDFRHYTMESGADANVELFKYLLPEVIDTVKQLKEYKWKYEELCK